ncbi:MAG: ATP-dependent zinc metalloprotease FtsH [Planctomycetota bacterium]
MSNNTPPHDDDNRPSPPGPPPPPEGGRPPAGDGKKPAQPDRRMSLIPLIVAFAVIGVMLVLFNPEGASDYKKIPIGKLRSLMEVPPSKNKLLSVTRNGDEEYLGELSSEEFVDNKPFRKFRVVIGSEAAAREYSKLYDEPLAALLGENFRHERSQTRLTALLVAVLPWVLILGLMWFLFFRRIAGPGGMGGGGLFGFTRSRARMHTKETVNVTFKDVAGIDEAREEVSEIIQFLKNPEKFRRIGGRIPRGVLLVGPPGTGKTLLAKAIAGEAGVPFFSISGSDFVEMFVGVGASRVRDLFRQAKDSSPCIIFLDEIDAVGRRRGTGLGGGHDEREQTLNAILVEMDGFETDAGIIVVAATNRPDVLDPALLRPGRFDRQITIDLPDIRGREMILGVHIKKVKRGDDVDIRRIARGTPGFSGADLANLVNEAAIMAAMRGDDMVTMDAFNTARDKLLLGGRENKSRIMPEKELKITAWHEAGHAVVQHFMPETDPLYKVSIIPRGRMGGVTISMPLEDRMTATVQYLKSQLAMAFGGRVAEKIHFNSITTGASQDIKQATNMARRMVCEWGMSDKVGPLNYSDSEEHMFLGREIARTTNHGEEVTQLIDEEVRLLITTAQSEAERVLTEHRDKLDLLAEALLEFEQLEADEIIPLLDGQMTLDDLRKAKPRFSRSLKTSEELEAERNAEAERADAGADPGDADDDAEPVRAADATSEGGLPVPRALGGDDRS